MKLEKKAGLAAVAFVVVGAGVLGGAAIAAASDDGSDGAGGRTGYGFGSGPGRGADGGPSDGGQMAPHDHTEVSGDELAQVTDAVTAYDATITVQSVLADPDGSYDVLATQDDAPVMLEVSADLATITERTGGPGDGGRGAPGAHPDGERPDGGFPGGVPGGIPGEVPGEVPDPAASNT